MARLLKGNATVTASQVVDLTVADDLTVTDSLTVSGNIVMADDTSIGISDSDERIEFDASGDISVLGANFGIGTATPDANSSLTCYRNATSSYALVARQEYNGEYAALFNSAAITNPYGITIRFDTSKDDTTHRFFHCSSGGNKLIVYSNGDVYTATGTDIQELSDKRIKENVADYRNGLETLNLLRPRTFTYITNDEGETRSPGGKAGTHFGFIAQEIEEDVPDQNMKLFSTCTVEDDDPNADLFPDKISYNTQLSAKDAIYISAIQELSAKVTALESA